MATGVEQKQPTTKYDAFVEQQLARVRGRVRALDAGKAVLLFLVLTLAYALVMALVDRAFELDFGVRLAAFLVYALAAVVVLGWVGLCLVRRVNPYYAAVQLEQTLPDAKNSVVNWLDLRDERLPAAIQGALSVRAARELKKADPERAVTSGGTWILGGVLTGLVIAVLVLFVMGPQQFVALLQRAFVPFREGGVPTQTTITMVSPETGDAVVRPGRPIPFRVQVEGRVPALNQEGAPRLWFRYNPADDFVGRALEQDTEGTWYWTMPADQVLNGGFSYKITAGDAATDEFQVRVSVVPQIWRIDVDYAYRPYLRLPNRNVSYERAIFPGLKGVRGTEATMTIRTNCDVRDGSLLISSIGDKEPVALPGVLVPNDNSALRFPAVPLEKNGFLRFQFTAKDGEKGVEPSQYPVIVIVDKWPEVKIDKPEKEIKLPANGTLQVLGSAHDDFGIKSMTLRMREVKGSVPLEPKPYVPAAPLKLVNGKYPNELKYNDFVPLEKVKSAKGTAFPLSPGMVLEYWLEAVDNSDYPEKDGQVGTSAKHLVTIVAPEKDQQKQKQDRQRAEQDKQKHDQQVKDDVNRLNKEAEKEKQDEAKKNPQSPKQKEREDKLNKDGQKLKDQLEKDNQQKQDKQQPDTKDDKKQNKPGEAKGADQKPQADKKDGKSDSKDAPQPQTKEGPKDGQKDASQQKDKNGQDKSSQAKDGGKNEEGKNGSPSAAKGPGKDDPQAGPKGEKKDSADNQKSGAKDDKSAAKEPPQKNQPSGNSKGDNGSGQKPGQAKDSGTDSKTPDNAKAEDKGGGKGQPNAQAKGGKNADPKDQATSKANPSGSDKANAKDKGETKTEVSKAKDAPKGEEHGKGTGKSLDQNDPMASSKEGKSTAGDKQPQAKKKDGSGGNGSAPSQAKDTSAEKAKGSAKAKGGGGDTPKTERQPTAEEIEKFAKDLNSDDPKVRKSAEDELKRAAEKATDPKMRDAADKALDDVNKGLAQAKGAGGSSEKEKQGEAKDQGRKGKGPPAESKGGKGEEKAGTGKGEAESDPNGQKVTKSDAKTRRPGGSLSGNQSIQDNIKPQAPDEKLAGRGGDLTLEDMRKLAKTSADKRKKAGIDEQQWQKFLKELQEYEQWLDRQNATTAKAKTPNVQGTSSLLPSVRPRSVGSTLDSKINPLDVDRALPPPEFREAQRRFTTNQDQKKK